MALQWAFPIGTASIMAETFAWASNSYIVFRKIKTSLILFEFITIKKKFILITFGFLTYFLFDLVFQSISVTSSHMFWL